jgi:outer membrane protein OmpA-like peptidoglycan-associated protein
MVGRILACRLGMAFAMALALMAVSPANAQDEREVSGQIEWGLWIDADGCMHWWADGGIEGYMVPRRDPKTGKPVCLKKSTCLVERTDVLFDSGSADLTASGRARLSKFFRDTGAVGYAIYGHTDSQGSAGLNDRLSVARAKAVASVARASGASVERQRGFGESQPIASNDTVEGRAKNRRVEIVCYK